MAENVDKEKSSSDSGEGGDTSSGDHSLQLPIAVQASRTEGHRAGFDAFMTGFIFSHFIAKHGRFRDLPKVVHMSDLGMEDYQNKVTLGGKDIPLQILKSNFAKTSKEHTEKLSNLKYFV